MKFIKLTGCQSDLPTWINPEKICSIDINTAGPRPITCIYLDKENSIGVRETPEQILEMLK